MIQKYVIMALVAIGIAVAGFFYGKHVESVERDAAILKAVKVEVEKANEKAKEDFEKVLKAEQLKANRKLEEAKRNVRIIKEIQTNPIYITSDCNIPDDGLRLWNDEAAGKTSSTPESDGQVSGRTTETN